MRPASSRSYRWRGLRSVLHLLALTVAPLLTSCGARSIGDWKDWEPDGGGAGGGGGAAGGAGGGWSPIACAPCDDPMVDCAACYIQGQEDIYRCPLFKSLDCLYLQEEHVDANGHAYTCYYC